MFAGLKEQSPLKTGLGKSVCLSSHVFVLGLPVEVTVRFLPLRLHLHFSLPKDLYGRLHTVLARHDVAVYSFRCFPSHLW